MMPWSGLSLVFAKHACETGTSELHRTSIMLAAAALSSSKTLVCSIDPALAQVEALKGPLRAQVVELLRIRRMLEKAVERAIAVDSKPKVTNSDGILRRRI